MVYTCEQKQKNVSLCKNEGNVEIFQPNLIRSSKYLMCTEFRGESFREFREIKSLQNIWKVLFPVLMASTLPLSYES